ncbi:hypothetical protein OSCI_3090004 [Kamptonema sp. PCC 6506]|nr:hypothetical protein OSCI_3090004 [Kamptonema sp. PCC 6506]
MLEFPLMKLLFLSDQNFKILPLAEHLTLVACYWESLSAV